jgi:hypothetical protein
MKPSLLLFPWLLQSVPILVADAGMKVVSLAAVASGQHCVVEDIG